ncbi:ECF transporter S component [Marinilactibacillus piezotolerans]|uniref:ECF transporter S component n=1 Tax=Marinilactibacillus piezotolerans TaxID=258723 RepID=UPI0009B113E0|nr:ECF transporter S component [Marinilactibacillus piezotolerans]
MPAHRKKSNPYRLAILGILTAIILIQNFVPFLGNIPIPPLNPTIIHITVIIAAIVLGTKDGMIVGGIWGITRMVRAYTVPATPLDWWLWTNPVIALLPRILIGFFTGLVYQMLKRLFPEREKTSIAISAVVGALTNTIFVLLFIYLFYGEQYAQAINVDVSNLANVLLVIVGTSGIAEAVLAAIVSPLIAVPLKKLRK